MAIAFGDSADIIQYPWGGFIYLKAGAHKKDQSYSLQTLAGLKLAPVFQYFKFKYQLIQLPQNYML
jgi:hypothetical protein